MTASPLSSRNKVLKTGSDIFHEEFDITDTLDTVDTTTGRVAGYFVDTEQYGKDLAGFSNSNDAPG